MADGKKVSRFGLERLNSKAAMEKEREKDVRYPGFTNTIPRAMRSRAVDKAKAESEGLINKYGGDAAKSRGFMAYEKSGDPAAKTTMQRVMEKKSKAKTPAKPAMAPNRAMTTKKKP
jgi:hypothetical protein